MLAHTRTNAQTPTHILSLAHTHSLSLTHILSHAHTRTWSYTYASETQFDACFVYL